MIETLQNIFNELNILPHKNEGVTIARVSNSHEGLTLTERILASIVTQQTLLLLSGGRTPKELYTSLAGKKLLHPGAVGMVDERYGKRMHKDSNEVMLINAGFREFLSRKNIPFYPVLHERMNREETATSYDEQLRSLFTIYQKSIALLGIGLDGHTAGIPANPIVWQEGFGERSRHMIVAAYDDHGGFYKERITMTSLGLSMMDLLLVLVFGDDKKDALEKVFSDGSMEEVPGRFYKQPEIAKKTVIITDQMM